jgi:spore coat polysaccharide biosynthesis predicted glycosyltransferase SpsG
MRCLTLAEALQHSGHDAVLMTADIDVPWLADSVAASGVDVVPCDVDALPAETILALEPDWVVVDSYTIGASRISGLARDVAVLAIVDGDERGIDATLFLDQNLGAESVHRRPELLARMLAGAEFALVRDSVLGARRRAPWIHDAGPVRVLSFLGGSDPTGSSAAVVSSILTASPGIALTVVAPEARHQGILAGIGQRQIALLAPTPALPDLLSRAEIVVTAAGTSAWDVCSLGLPAVLVAVVDNQRASLVHALARGVALGVDAVDQPSELGRVGDRVAELIADPGLRRRVGSAAIATFDGGGKFRVVDAMERASRR